MIPAIAVVTFFISASVFILLRLMRTVDSARCSGIFNAASTWDGSMVPAEHAEPAETEIPCRSRAISSCCAGISGKVLMSYDPVSYTVRRGDTVSEIAYKYDLEMSTII